MRTATKVFAVAAVLGAIGGSVFLSSRPATANGFAGPFAGGTQGGATTAAIQAATLGEDLSFDTLSLTTSDPSSDALALAGSARLRFAPSTVNANAYCQWNNSIGVTCASAFAVGAGASVWTDSLISRQGDRSVRVDQAQGLGLSPQSSIGTCDNTTGSGHAREGDLKVLSGAGLSARTRLCLCTSDGAGTPAYAWLNVTTGTVGTASACNN